MLKCTLKNRKKKGVSLFAQKHALPGFVFARFLSPCSLSSLFPSPLFFSLLFPLFIVILNTMPPRAESPNPPAILFNYSSTVPHGHESRTPSQSRPKNLPEQGILLYPCQCVTSWNPGGGQSLCQRRSWSDGKRRRSRSPLLTPPCSGYA